MRFNERRVELYCMRINHDLVNGLNKMEIACKQVSIKR